MAIEAVPRDGVEVDNLEKPPFTTKYLDEEKLETGSEILTIRINRKEREIINELKGLLHYGQDAKAIKVGLQVARNVIQSTFGDVLMRKISDADRRRPLLDDCKKEG